jgi:hypothetical protein
VSGEKVRFVPVLYKAFWIDEQGEFHSVIQTFTDEESDMAKTCEYEIGHDRATDSHVVTPVLCGKEARYSSWFLRNLCDLHYEAEISLDAWARQQVEADDPL